MGKNGTAFACTLAFAVESLVGCSSGRPPAATLDISLVELGAYMAGSFSSRGQSELDLDFRDVRLPIVRLRPDQVDAVWLYVEQALATSLGAPYRQRNYRLSHVGRNLHERRVFEPSDPQSLAGAWCDRARLALLASDALEERPRCEILRRHLEDDSHVGSTLGGLCNSAQSGAAHAAPEVAISARTLVSWDRGFDAASAQVWGAENGGYEFVKLTDEPAD